VRELSQPELEHTEEGEEMIKTRRVKYADKFLEMDYGTVVIKTPLVEITISVGGETVDREPLESIEILNQQAATVDPPYSSDQHRTLTRIRGKAKTEKR